MQILNGWTEAKDCPVCENSDNVPYAIAYSKPWQGIRTPIADIITATKLDYYQCLLCGMVWQNPRFTDATLEKYYSTGAYREWAGMSVEDMDRDEAERAERIFNEINNLNLHFETHVDVGCSRGYLLKKTQELLGTVIYGVDYNTSYAKDVRVYSTVHELPFPVDLITMIHILEHVTHPVQFVKEAADHLTGGGYMVIEVPSHNSLGGPLRLAHTLFMEPWVLVNICERAKLDIVAVSMKEHTLVVATKGD